MPPSGNSLRRALRRSSREWGLFAQAWLALLVADLCLRWLSFPRVERLFAPPPVRPRAEPFDEAVGLRVWAVDAAARHHARPMTCLPRTLSLRWLLGRAGISTDLRIGVARQGDRLLAHAWVERDGQSIGERAGDLSAFHPLREASSLRR